MEYKVSINGKIYKAAYGESAADLLRRAGLGEFACGGRGRCGKCAIVIKGKTSPVTEREKQIFTRDEISGGSRLACLTYIEGDCDITVKERASGAVLSSYSTRKYEISPNFEKYGVAADIGTTTVVTKLYSADGRRLAEASELNPQRVFGADVVSRMEAALSGKGSELSSLIRGALDEMIKQNAKDAKIDARDIDLAVITGNTVMMHFLAGYDTKPLTCAPFRAKHLFGCGFTAKELGMDFNEAAKIYIPPCASAFIGADTVCALYACGAYGENKTEITVDIGTNGEIVLNKKGSLFACSTAAGPAFEGAGISCGTRGRPGAIDRVYVKENGIEAHVIGDIAADGICGSGIVDAIAAFLKTGMIDETGYAEDAPLKTAENVYITQNDIRAVQLAKSAISAGIVTLMKTAGAEPGDIDTLYIAGGFGSYLDVKNAGAIGLIPAELTDKVTVSGNAALSGAEMLLLSRRARKECEDLVLKIKVKELSSDTVFAEEYVERMLFSCPEV